MPSTEYASTIATATGGWIGGFIVLAVLLLICVGVFLIGVAMSGDSIDGGFGISMMVASVIAVPIVIGCWWWASAFTTSGDYHAWNVKNGTVEQISKRIVPAGDSGIQERFVVRFRETDGLYGIDDTRASLLRPGMRVSLKCKKDYQWGVPREAHGWGCRWNTIPRDLR